MPPDDVDGRAAPTTAAVAAAAGRTAVAAMIMNDEPCDDADLVAAGSDADLEATARWWDVARDAGAFASATETDVAIIGNGPAGIALSWMLDGNVPYYDDSVGPHPNTVLHGKLGLRRDLSLLDQDLAWLSDGLEGRSANPVALLFDTLHHPDSDVDVNGAQPARLRWAHEPARARSHLVIGRGPPGGSWAAMHEDLETVSYGDWMQLPGYPMAQWAADTGLAELATASARLKRRYVARYYEDYVVHEGLADHFQSGWQVVAMRRAQPLPTAAAAVPEGSTGTVALPLAPLPQRASGSSGSPGFFGWASATYLALIGRTSPRTASAVLSSSPPSSAASMPMPMPPPAAPPATPTWELVLVQRTPASALTPMTARADVAVRVVRARSVVIATGMFDVPRRLGIPGEDLTQFVFHSPAAAGALLGSPAAKGVSSPPTPLAAVPELVLPPTIAPSRPRVDVGTSSDNDDDDDTSARPHRKLAVVVGSGLSAADAILALRRMGVDVVHFFRHRKGTSPLAKCPRESYPEYAGLYREMRRGRPVEGPTSAYVPVQDGELTSVTACCRDCTVGWRDTSGAAHTVEHVAAVLVLIGSQPSLSFLPPCLASQTQKTSQQNPLAIHPLTYAWPNEDALFVVGSLTGDNFVRFLLGGALAVAASLVRPPPAPLALPELVRAASEPARAPAPTTATAATPASPARHKGTGEVNTACFLGSGSLCDLASGAMLTSPI